MPGASNVWTNRGKSFSFLSGNQIGSFFSSENGKIVSLPPTSAVEVIKTEPSVCQFVSSLVAGPIDSHKIWYTCIHIKNCTHVDAQNMHTGANRFGMREGQQHFSVFSYVLLSLSEIEQKWLRSCKSISSQTGVRNITARGCAAKPYNLSALVTNHQITSLLWDQVDPTCAHCIMVGSYASLCVHLTKIQTMFMRLCLYFNWEWKFININ